MGNMFLDELLTHSVSNFVSSTTNRLIQFFNTKNTCFSFRIFKTLCMKLMTRGRRTCIGGNRSIYSGRAGEQSDDTSTTKKLFGQIKQSKMASFLVNMLGWRRTCITYSNRTN